MDDREHVKRVLGVLRHQTELAREQFEDADRVVEKSAHAQLAHALAIRTAAQLHQTAAERSWVEYAREHGEFVPSAEDEIERARRLPAVKS